MRMPNKKPPGGWFFDMKEVTNFDTKFTRWRGEIRDFNYFIDNLISYLSYPVYSR